MLKATKRKAPVRRKRHVMPKDIHWALAQQKVLKAYKARPSYQQNDYVGWIMQAKREETRLKRLFQMISELKTGGVYMKMKHNPSATAKKGRHSSKR